jgi:hypothetical protein
MNHLGIDVRKRKCRAALKGDKGMVLDEQSPLVMIETKGVLSGTE